MKMTEKGDDGLVPIESEPEQLPEELKEVAQEVGEEKVRRILALHSIHMERHSGPLPHPKLFSQYGEVQKDAPERILRMAEKEQEHEHLKEMKLLEGDEKRANWGLGLGFFIFVIVFIGAIYLISIGFEIAGYVSLAALALNGVINFFRTGRERHISKEK